MLERDVAQGIHRLEHAYTNVYLVEDESGVTVVDAGVPSAWQPTLAALADIGRSVSDVRAVVLTHAHFDHLGFAERARAELGVPVHVHEDDVPLTRHPRQYAHERPRSLYFATQVRALPIVAALVRARAFWPPPVREVARYRDPEGALPVPGWPHVVPTPGHTLGHCALHFPDRDAVIAGDAVVMLDPYTAERGPKIVAGAATADSERALRTLDALARTEASTVLTGHGEAWRGGTAAAVEAARRAGPS
jgi:glyoxylase-like metal-dependent hydrolase (beta-lactamase superfamily II)